MLDLVQRQALALVAAFRDGVDDFGGSAWRGEQVATWADAVRAEVAPWLAPEGDQK
jgi:hypothetical protein